MIFIKTNLVRYLTLRFASAITLFPFVFIDKKTKLSRRLVQHEKIHILQQKELFIIPFYILYLGEYLFNLIRYKSTFKAYRNISFEKECYENESVRNYLENRKPYSWRKYI